MMQCETRSGFRCTCRYLHSTAATVRNAVARLVHGFPWVSQYQRPPYSPMRCSLLSTPGSLGVTGGGEFAAAQAAADALPGGKCQVCGLAEGLGRDTGYGHGTAAVGHRMAGFHQPYRTASSLS